MPKRKKRLSDYLSRQNNTRGFGLARDVKAGQAFETPAARAHYNKRKYGSIYGPRGRQRTRYRV